MESTAFKMKSYLWTRPHTTHHPSFKLYQLQLEEWQQRSVAVVCKNLTHFQYQKYWRKRCRLLQYVTRLLRKRVRFVSQRRPPRATASLKNAWSLSIKCSAKSSRRRRRSWNRFKWLRKPKATHWPHAIAAAAATRSRHSRSPKLLEVQLLWTWTVPKMLPHPLFSQKSNNNNHHSNPKSKNLDWRQHSHGLLHHGAEPVRH